MNRRNSARDIFSRLLREYGDRIYSFAIALSGNEIEAADLTAEAFARAWKSFGRYDSSRPFESWMFKIVQNIHIDRKRRLKNRSTVSLDDSEEGFRNGEALSERTSDRSQRPEDELANLEADQMVRAALERIPEHFREPLMMCDLFLMSYEAISEISGLPIGTVRSRIFRGRRMLKGIVEPYFTQGGALWTATRRRS